MLNITCSVTKKMVDYNDIALFRYAIIAPLVTKTYTQNSINEFCNKASEITYSFKNETLKISSGTIKTWYYNYLKDGFNGLFVKVRIDKNTCKNINEETILRIINIRKERPSITGVALYKLLIEEGYIFSKDIALSTFLRYLKNNNLKAKYESNVDRRKYEQEYANDCWQADTSHGPRIKINGISTKTYIIMFIDDKSRLITGIGIFLNDNAINMQSVFKNACKTYGIPKKLYVDNGTPYSNKQLSLICARLGIELIHARPYSPQGKAKCERMFRTIKDKWMRANDWNLWNSINEVNNSLKNYLLDHYTNKIHSTTNETPNNRWHNDFKIIKKIDEKKIDESFYHELSRKVLKDRTIMIEKIYYEVPVEYIGKTISIKYDPNNMKNIYLMKEGEKLEEIQKVDIVSNSKVKRQSIIDYNEIIERN